MTYGISNILIILSSALLAFYFKLWNKISFLKKYPKIVLLNLNTNVISIEMQLLHSFHLMYVEQWYCFRTWYILFYWVNHKHVFILIKTSRGTCDDLFLFFLFLSLQLIIHTPNHYLILNVI
jgi:hypothetical protein